MFRRLLLGLIAVVVVLFVAIQLVPVNRSNPPVASEPQWDSPDTRALAERACFDCHSNETEWPWYSYVAPVSWGITREVQEGREVLNFSEWQRAYEEAHEAAEVLQEGEMPPAKYIPLHPEAKLTASERQQLIAGLQATTGGSGGESGGENEESDEDDD